MVGDRNVGEMSEKEAQKKDPGNEVDESHLMHAVVASFMFDASENR